MFAILQKFCGGPEILDQVFVRSYRNAVNVPEFLDTVFQIVPKCCARSRSSGQGVFVPFITKESVNSRNSGIATTYFGSYRKSVVVQKFWTKFLFDPTEMLQTFLNNWTRCFGSYRNAVHVPEVSRSSGHGVFVHNERRYILQISGMATSDHTEILWWSLCFECRTN